MSMRTLLQFMIVVTFGFIAGGGWHFMVPGDDFIYGLFHKVDTAEAEAASWRALFLYCGPAGALCAAIAFTIMIFAKKLIQQKRSQSSGSK